MKKLATTRNRTNNKDSRIRIRREAVRFVQPSPSERGGTLASKRQNGKEDWKREDRERAV